MSPTRKTKNTLHLLKQLKSHPAAFSATKYRHVNPIKWYNCGPTVYSDSHMGHARNYLTIDILRRIVENFFNLECYFVQNITDLDDKLINRVHECKKEGKHESRTDASALKNIAMEFEESYWKDMEALHIKKPNHILRVTEHMHEIQDMVTKLLTDGYAYVGKDSGSIYFHTKKLIDDGYKYDHFGLCCTDAEQWRGGEEIIGTHEKHSAKDFVLWKRDTSDFGYSFKGHVKGRPGWHIECSAMSSILGPHIDVHSGGIDLQFPHHTNEIAQSQAYHHTKSWVRDWIHVGHLHIQGLKMSKSTKNFTSIQEGLKQHDARVVRMMALQHNFADSVHYSPDLMQHAVDMERLFREYFLKTTGIIRHASKLTPKPGLPSIQLRQKLWETKDSVRDALLDNFDTPRALFAMAELVKYANRYEQQTGITVQLDNILLQDIAVYLTQMFRIFGFMDDRIGYSSDQLGGSETASSLMDAFSQFRADIRQLATTGNDTHTKEMRPIITACDEVRNSTLPELGVRLEDLPDGKSIWKFQNPEEILNDIATQKEQELLRKKHGEMAREKQRERSEQLRIAPRDYFKTVFSGEYSKYDMEGIPTHDASGEELSKSKQKKLKKLLDKHTSAHAKVNQES